MSFLFVNIYLNQKKSTFPSHCFDLAEDLPSEFIGPRDGTQSSEFILVETLTI